MIGAVSQDICEDNSNFPRQYCVFPVMLLGVVESS